jgi:hypothetical protein
MGISTRDWRGEEDSGAAEVDRLQQQDNTYRPTFECADGGYDLSDIRQHHPEPRTVVRRKCRVQMLTGSAANAQWPGGLQATMAFSQFGLSVLQSKSSVSSLVQRYLGSIALCSVFTVTITAQGRACVESESDRTA